MLRIKALDETFPIANQLGADQSPAILVNVFEVDAPDEEALLKAWEADANWMKRQPGYISTQLHRAIGGSRLYLNYAVWESVAHFRAAFTHPEFASALAHYPSSAVAAPHLFRRLAVANLCAAQGSEHVQVCSSRGWRACALVDRHLLDVHCAERSTWIA